MTDSLGSRNTARGVILMLLGVLLFAANDTLGKWLVGAYAVGQLLLFRSAVGLLVLLPSLWRSRAAVLRVRQPGLQALRAGLSAVEATLFFVSLSLLPLAEVITFYMASPIFVTALSPLLLRERVGWRRWTAVGVGFLGVVLAVNPQGSLSLAALVPVAGSLGYALFVIATRRLAGTPAPVLLGWQFLVAMLLGLVLVSQQSWVAPGPLETVLLIVLGLGSLAGNVCVTHSLRLAPASTVMPLHYTLIPWGILFGYLFFGEMLTLRSLVGAAIIVGAGLFILWREQALARLVPG
ncbi:EamA domain-containing membrane protein RarD [Roseomonas rosea]|uniref:EamA domain-containing membrane protein RarD n=1 Tax=Muricoccus roseus TaxID=198092 RepID=A0A1M6KZS9_9PROT|nr:DMT family transporter [Roseomonas rosea]SHJ64488.1 EamA domain-containing membrane protein RarD [Roseomonas rosea]